MPPSFPQFLSIMLALEVEARGSRRGQVVVRLAAVCLPVAVQLGDGTQSAFFHRMESNVRTRTAATDPPFAPPDVVQIRLAECRTRTMAWNRPATSSGSATVLLATSWRFRWMRAGAKFKLLTGVWYGDGIPTSRTATQHASAEFPRASAQLQDFGVSGTGICGSGCQRPCNLRKRLAAQAPQQQPDQLAQHVQELIQVKAVPAVVLAEIDPGVRHRFW